MNVGELIELLMKYPKDIKVVLGVEPNGQVGLYYNVQCGGLDTGNERIFYVASKDLSEDIELIKQEGFLD